MSRRRFLLTGLGLGGALLVGWGVLPPRSRLGGRDTLQALGDEVALNGWLKIAAGGEVRLALPRAEMGQGVHTALAMLVAEELDLPLALVRVVEAQPEALHGNVAAAVDAALFFEPVDMEPGGQTRAVRSVRWLLEKLTRELGVVATGGSSSITDLFPVLPLAAATVRAQLLGAASLQWKLPVSELVVQGGVISHPSGPRAHFGELARLAAATPPGDVQIKPRERWRLVGTAAPRSDLPPKVDGRAVFGIDIRLPGQLYAAILHAPMLGGSPGAVDVDAVLRRPGVHRVVRLGPMGGSAPALAVVARSTWHAQQAAAALQVQWQPPPGPPPDTRDILQRLQAQARQAAEHGAGFAFRDRGDADGQLAQAQRRHEAVYSAPYLAHMAMEPLNCTARVSDGRVELWVPTQVPSFARTLAAQVAGVRESAVTVHVPYLGGGFGRRLEVDVVGQAVRVAMEAGGAPVQLLWSREQDTQNGFYRPAAAAVMQAALDERGLPLALRIGSAGDAVLPRYYERVFPLLATRVDAPDKTAAEGLFGLPYELPHFSVRHVATRHGVPVGSWRSVGHSHNAFFAESFVDELAHLAKTDPVAFRLERLGTLPRHAAVLRLAAEKAGWGRPLAPGRARGVALHDSYNSIVAQVMEVSVDATPTGPRPRVHRVVAAVDCGTVVHPGIVAQQMESAVLFGLSAALYGRIDIEGGVVQQRNFPDQPMLTLAQTPAIETHIVPSSREPGGMGEPGVPPAAPALANALFALTGRRLRDLPLSL